MDTLPTSQMTQYRPVVLIVLDGWGESNNSEGNAIKKATLPTIDKFNTYYPMVLLQASGSSVGLPWGESGNSEVGHITLGTGRIIYQNMPRIALSIQDGSFFRNPALLECAKFTKERTDTLHLIGLVGQGSVHSYIEHLFALMEYAKQQKFANIFIHAFTDGRDSPPTSGTDTIGRVQKRIQDMRIGRIASVIGRNWAMDRNNNWDRIEKAYKMLVEGVGEKILDPIKYMEDSYSKGITDEFIEPGVVTDSTDGAPIGLIKDGDAVVFFNFREDRARQLTKAFALPGFDKFKRDKRLDINFCTLIEFEKDLPVSVAFAPQEVHDTLGETLSKNGKRQLRIAETEKYAHVTYFFNGGKEDAWPGEDHILIPSPVVPSFDQVPEMSAAKITETVIAKINEEKYDFILANYANADMVGHTGNEDATITACQALDKTLSLLIPEILRHGGCVFITADHGNAEEVKNFRTGQIDTEHSTNPVPLWYITPMNHRQKDTETLVRQHNEVIGLLSDVAPTILEVMGIEKSEDMLGSSLLPLLQ